MSEKKRGRPRTKEVPIWQEKYYALSEARDNKAIRKTLEERLFKGFEEVHRLANDKELGWFEINIIKGKVSAILDRI